MTQAISARSRLGYKFAWLFGAQYDLLWFAVPLVLSCLMIFYSYSGLLLATACTFIVDDLFPVAGTVHGAATWFHYTDAKNRANYFGNFKRVLIFLIAPVAILLASAMAYAGHFGPVVYYIYMIWTIQHLTQQNVGILLLYHNPAEAVVPRTIEALSLQIPAALFGAVFLLHPFMSDALYRAAGIGSILVCFLICCTYIWHHYQQARSGAITNVPALLFWLLSVWFFLALPFVGYSFYLGMAVPLFVHWCQYIGLNWILVARKYEAENKNHVLLRRPVVAFIVFCAVLTVLFNITLHFSRVSNEDFMKSSLTGLIIGLSLVHYFQDAFIWRFREQFQRQTILPFLKPRPRTS